MRFLTLLLSLFICYPALAAPPEVFDLHRATEKNTPTTFTLIGRDDDGDELIYSIVTEPNLGTVSINGDMVTYIPKPDLNYSETFTYKATDNFTDSGISTVTMSVFPGYLSAARQLGQDIEGEVDGDQSGFSVSFSADGQSVAIGAPFNNGNGQNSGSVRVYNLVGNVWRQLGLDIEGEAEGDRSGFSVSLSADGQTVAIGAKENDGDGKRLSGHTRIYTFTDGTWQQLGQDIDGETVSQSGQSVNMSADGRTVAIGARYYTGTYTWQGHVKIYTFTGDRWQQLGHDIDGEAAGDESGWSVSISADGRTVAIGAPYNDGDGNQAGHVRIYTLIGDVWHQLGHDIDPGDGQSKFGHSVSISADGRTVAIGADIRSYLEYVKVYTLIDDEWKPLGNPIFGDRLNDNFGSSVSISADGLTLAVGAPNNDKNGDNSGHVRIYTFNGNAWQQLGQDIDGEAIGDNSGSSVSISADGRSVAIGAPYNDDNGNSSGHVRIYELTDIDSDFDGIGNSIDVYPFTSITGFVDTDNDGAPNNCDDICIASGMEADDDDDGDGLSDINELSAKLDPLNPDTDNDGILDGDELVSIELLSTFPELSFKVRVIRPSSGINLEQGGVEIVSPSGCQVQAGFSDNPSDIASISIPLHENAVSGNYKAIVRNDGFHDSSGHGEEILFEVNNPLQDTSKPQVIEYDITSRLSSDVIEVTMSVLGMDSGVGLEFPWGNSSGLNHTVHVGDAPSNYVGNVSDLDDVELTGDTYQLKTRHDLSSLTSAYKEAPTVNYVRICEQSYNGIEYTIDTDGDNAVDEFDIAPNNPAVWIDVDKDGKDNSIDNCPLTANTEQLDFDTDGAGDVCDTDDDNDGLNDELDAFPLNRTEQTDSDNDGLGDNYELFNDLDRFNPDVDSDGLKDGAEIELGTNPKLADSDDDGVIDGKDKFPLISIGDLLDTDSDGSPDECDEACLALGMTADRDGIPAYLYIESESFAFATLTPTAKVIVTGSQGNNFFDIARYVNDVTLVGQSFLVSGSGSVDGFMVMPGVKYDLANLKGGVDAIYFSGPFAEYADSILLDPGSGVMQLSRLTDIGEEIVQFIATASAADVLVFTDGAISTSVIKDAIINETPMDDLVLDNSVSALDTKPISGGTVKHIVLDNNGAGVMALGPNISTLISGSSGIDHIYVPAGSVVDASNLKSGQDELYVEGNRADYYKSFDNSGNIVMTRDVIIEAEVVTESITVASGGNVATNDLIIFADQQVDTATLKSRIGTIDRSLLPPPVPSLGI